MTTLRAVTRARLFVSVGQGIRRGRSSDVALARERCPDLVQGRELETPRSQRSVSDHRPGLHDAPKIEPISG
jgi:hypothetical protein